MSVAQPLPIDFFVFWKLPPLALPRLLVLIKESLEENFRVAERREVKSKS